MEEVWQDSSHLPGRNIPGLDCEIDLERRDTVRVSGFSDDTNIVVENIELPSGVGAVRITFNDNDALTLVKATAENLVINLDDNLITL